MKENDVYSLEITHPDWLSTMDRQVADWENEGGAVPLLAAIHMRPSSSYFAQTTG
ncbi:hypothetical protein AB1K62_02255 [Parasphingorhabdus sp. JC815]|uniref:hypothetical protein n=1 Tax=Parasphingorhabdus sp. JC815 TaxID=3232140 RepID=UPI003457913B